MVLKSTDGIANSYAAELKRAEQALFLKALDTSDLGVNARADDHIEISSLSVTLTAAIEAHETERADRVRAIHALYQRDAYPVDSARLANAMVSDALFQARN
jgi:hypothetical protein